MELKPWMLVLFPLALLGFGAFSTMTNADIKASRELQRNTAQNRAQARVEARQSESDSNLAITRYESGNCLLSTVPIKPGLIFPDVPSDMPICDEFGWTAQLGATGTVQNLAYTSDANTIRRFMGW